jgi:hypothetical protein
MTYYKAPKGKPSKDLKHYFCFVSACEVGNEELLSGICLYQFKERRKLVKILLGSVENIGWTADLTATRVKDDRNSDMISSGSALEALAGLKF